VSVSAGELEQLPDDAADRASALAAVAEACVLALPTLLIVVGVVVDAVATAAFVAAFVMLFPIAVTLLRRFRDVPSAAPIGAAIVGVLAVSIGGPDLPQIVLRLIGVALVAVLAASLAVRDRREPVGVQIAWGAAALGVECAAAAGHTLSAWRLPLIVLVPLFVVSSLASRAATVWNEPGVEPSDRVRWRARFRLGSPVYVATLLMIAAAAIRGGVWQQLGLIVAPIGRLVVDVVLLVIEVILRPIFWLVERVHLHPQAAERFLRQLRRNTPRSARFTPGAAGVGPLVGRLLGLAVILAIAYGTYRVLRRLRPPTEAPDPDVAGLAPVTASSLETRADPGARRRVELPADAVRRWYAEVLLALGRRDLLKEPSTTPGEFLGQVRRSYPALGDDLAALTKAYEDVRYGALRLDSASLRDLEGRQRAVLRELKRATGPEPAPPG
jgi:hypothetical protein